MTPRQGPTKKLAPTLSPGTICPHEYTEEDGLQLEVDCLDCKGAHDLFNPKCLSAIVGVMVDGAEPEAIVLKRFIHKRYRADLVKRASEVSRELARLNRAIDSLKPPSDRRCRTCPASIEQSLGRFRRILLEDPISYVPTQTKLRSLLQSHIGTYDCPTMQTCIENALELGSGRS